MKPPSLLNRPDQRRRTLKRESVEQFIENFAACAEAGDDDQAETWARIAFLGAERLREQDRLQVVQGER
jgi:hypothetical protein